MVEITFNYNDEERHITFEYHANGTDMRYGRFWFQHENQEDFQSCAMSSLTVREVVEIFHAMKMRGSDYSISSNNCKTFANKLFD